MTGAGFKPGLLQGRCFGAAELAQVRTLVAEQPVWSRRPLSEQLARRWAGRNPAGQLQDMAARTLLRKLEGRGWITLPARRQIPNQRRNRQSPAQPEPFAERFGEPAGADVRVALPELLPLSLEEISRKKHAGQQAVFSRLLERHHYLSHRGTVGENLQYLISDRQGNPLACVLFGAAAWQCRAREAHIGWDAATRARGLA